MDDFHNIHTIRCPNQITTSEATHMASLILDIHPTVPAVHLNNVIGIHRNVPVHLPHGQTINCLGGIHAKDVAKMMTEFMKEFNKTYLESLPQTYKDLKMASINQCLNELRVYNTIDQTALHTLDSVLLIDEVEKDLHSKNDYLDVLHHILASQPAIEEYAKSFVIPSPGDWPTWYQQKKIICEWSSSQPEALLSLMPEIGPFHVHLNSVEDVVIKYHFVFEYLCKSIFGNHFVLAHKPKPWRISLCIVAALTGWLHIRESIIAAFGSNKDPEYLVLFHLLDELVPLVFYQYPVVFRGGHLELYKATMFRLCIMFISMSRRHYNKASLSWLSDLQYQAENLPELYNFRLKNLSLVTEKKVEVYHSVLRRHISEHDKHHKIQETARVLNATNFKSEFVDGYVKSYCRVYTEKDMTLIAGLSGEALLKLFENVAQHTGESKKLPRKRDRRGREYGPIPYHLATLDVQIETKSMPLGFKWTGKEPNPDVACDHEECKQHGSVANPEGIVQVTRMACGHAFHHSCVDQEKTGCPVCSPLLEVEVNKLACSWNIGLVSRGHNDEEPFSRSPKKQCR